MKWTSQLYVVCDDDIQVHVAGPRAMDDDPLIGQLASDDWSSPSGRWSLLALRRKLSMTPWEYQTRNT